MNQPSYPQRVRLYRGTNVHAARPKRDTLHLTFCGLVTVATDHFLDPDTSITCRACQRAFDKETNR